MLRAYGAFDRGPASCFVCFTEQINYGKGVNLLTEPQTGATRRTAHATNLYCRSGSRSGAESVKCVRWWVRVSFGVPAERVFPV
jgi:hypothetical protein